MLNLNVTNRKTRKRKDYQFTQHSILIGRQQNCDVILESTSVSRRHAKITVSDHQVFLEDLGSGNGTSVGDKLLRQGDKIQIRSGDQSRIEEFNLEIHFDEKPKRGINLQSTGSKADVTDPDIIEIKMIKKVLGALDHEKLSSLTVVSEPFQNKKSVFEENMNELVIGRDASCDLFVDSNTVSRRHAIIKVKWGGYIVRDLGSKNGTTVNGERVEEKTIKDGDEIVFGAIKTIFKNPQEFDFKTISESINEHKTAVKTSPEPSEASKATLNENPPSKTEDTKETPKEKSETKPIEKEDKKEEKKDSPKKKKKNQLSNESLDELISDGTDPASKTKAKPKQSKPSFLKSFSATELILFSFGGLVIIAIIYLLLNLLEIL
jgi:pSer/pThr/pTyr-binding forkhead associated (FHA) protein